MITTKTCSTCEHFPNDDHCAGCVWDDDKGENTNWELKINPIVIERAVLDKIRAEIEAYQSDAFYPDDVMMNKRVILEIIDKYRIAERSDKE